VSALAFPQIPDPVQFVLLPILLALLLVTRGAISRWRIVAAAVLIAFTLGLRIDFGLFGLAGVGAAIVARGRVRDAAIFAVGSLALGAQIYLPFGILAGPGVLYDNLVGRSLRTGSYWTLPLPLDFHPTPGGGLLSLVRTPAEALSFYTPLLVPIAYLVALVALAIGWFRRRRAPALDVGLCVVALGTLVYLVARPAGSHDQPLWVLAIILLALGAARIRGAAPWVCAGVLALLIADAVVPRLLAAFRPPAESEIHVAVADGVEAAPREARAIERMVALVDSRDPPGQPIYVLPRRSDLINQADPLIYVFAQRSNPTTIDFGLLTGATSQNLIVAELRRVQPKVIVRWTDPLSDQPEPNRRGRSSGVHTVDDWVGLHYRLLARLYHYDVLVPAGNL
jgi:hypothetical protein